MSGGITLAYLAAAVLFIFSLGGLSQQETARRGNVYGIIGMTIALVATLFAPGSVSPIWAFLAVGAGGAVGWTLAQRVAMTEMPQLVAGMHSFVGLAAVLVGLGTYWAGGDHEGTEAIVHDLEIAADVIIGAITFTGSVVAWAKLDGRLSGKPMLLPGRHMMNAVAALLLLLMAVIVTMVGPTLGLTMLVLAAAVAGALGAHLVLAIGGADMPVVVSLLNSYSGWTAAAAGFMLGNDLLIITGALVGSSGAILSYIMCEAMNRSIWNVVFGGFGTEAPKTAAAPPPASDGASEVQSIEGEGFVELLLNAKSVLVVPGYGLAVARAQNDVKTLTDLLRARGADVRFAIHPVAGRLPGHMNVLLAEAGVGYDLVHELEDINDDFPDADLALVVGANDIVNPGAQTDTSSPIYGMPVLEAWKATTCVVMKRSMNVGYAGVGNPLFFKDNTRMLFGDAGDRLGEAVSLLRAQ
ncbi:MAG: NAD(P)(+) transhydrogenase (Re/Si-specific) subunit beta [Myxococcota bacterium]